MPASTRVTAPLFALFLMLSALPASAAVVRVRADASGPGSDGQTWQTAFKTVAAGLTAAQPGDEIWVAAGTYPERITMRPSVALYGGFAGTETGREQRDPDVNPAILKPTVPGSVVTAYVGVSRTAILDGFVVQFGTGTVDNTFALGGGVFCKGGSPTLQNNVFTGNFADAGSAIACRGGAAPWIEGNRIEENTSGGPDGGAIYVEASQPVIRGNIIRSNVARSATAGIASAMNARVTLEQNLIENNTGQQTGAISASASYIVVRGNVIRGNSALGTGAISAFNGSLTVENNRIVGNAGTVGGIYSIQAKTTVRNNWVGANGRGILLQDTTDSVIDGNTVVGNSTFMATVFTPPNEFGGAIQLARGSVSVRNNIVAFNESGIFVESDTTVDAAYNCVYGNAAFGYQGMVDPTGTNGNIAVDPRLASRAGGNLHIQPHSPCVDAGSPDAPAEGATDIDGQPRLQGARSDIGADESDGTVWPEAPPVVRVRPDGDDTKDGATWPSAMKTLSAALARLTEQGGGEVWIAEGVYPESIIVRGFTTLLGGFAGTEAQADQRDPTLHDSVVAGPYNSAILLDGGWRSAALDGLTVTSAPNSVAIQGIYITGAGAVIRNCDIRDNAGMGLRVEKYSRPLIVGNKIRGSRGNGIAVSDGRPTIQGNIISRNLGGISCNSANPDILENVITGNTYSMGGAIFVNNASPLIARNTITDNGGSAAIYVRGGVPRILNNVLLRNAKGGINAESSALIVSNTIADNNLAGLSVRAASPTVVNNILAFNAEGVSYTGAANNGPILRANCVYGNVNADYSGVVDPTGFFGNISEDPRFAGLYENNIHIQPDSPCVDAGENTPDLWPTDIDGQPRVQGARVDIGADESDGTVWSVARPVMHVRADGNDAGDGTTWATAKRTLSGALAAIPDGGDVWAAKGVYGGGLIVNALQRLYGGFNGTESSMDDRNPAANPTVIEGSGEAASGVVFLGSSRVTLFDGFTVRGAETYGLFTSTSVLTIRNCEIVENKTTGILLGAGGAVLDSVVARNGGVGIGGQNGDTTVANTLVRGNRLGGIQQSQGALTVHRVRVIGDGAPSGINVSNGRVDMDNSLVTGHGQDGIRLLRQVGAARPVRLVNNTIATNGTGIRTQSAGAVEITNNIVAFNGTGLACPQSNITLLNNDVFGNAVNYQSMADPGGSGGNMKADPLFRDMAAGDFRLTALSPAIDAGYNLIVQPGDVDLDGNPRIHGMRVDIGAYEFSGDDSLAIGDVRRALIVAGGMAIGTARDKDRLNVDGVPGITLTDAATLARQLAGLQP